jgi:hypothetical protein
MSDVIRLSEFRIGSIQLTCDDQDTHFKMPVPEGMASKMLCGKQFEVGKVYFVTENKAEVTCRICNEWLHA